MKDMAATEPETNSMESDGPSSEPYSLQSNPFDDYASREELVRENRKLFTDARMKWWERNRKTNGLSKSGALKKISGRFYYHRPRFYNWFDSQSD